MSSTRVVGPSVTPAQRSVDARSAPLIIWDVDRTLTKGDTLIPFLRRVLGPLRWSTALAQVAAHTAAHGHNRASLKECLLRHCLTDLEYADGAGLAQDFAHTIRTQMCRRDSLARWAWHQDRGHQLVLASASLDLYLHPLGQALGAERVLATGLQVHNGRFTGAMSTANCRGPEKARRINELIHTSRPAFVWVYSDSRSDQPSLDLADVAIRVRPWRTLITPHATTNPRSAHQQALSRTGTPGGTS